MLTRVFHRNISRDRACNLHSDLITIRFARERTAFRDVISAVTTKYGTSMFQLVKLEPLCDFHARPIGYYRNFNRRNDSDAMPVLKRPFDRD